MYMELNEKIEKSEYKKIYRLKLPICYKVFIVIAMLFFLVRALMSIYKGKNLSAIIFGCGLVAVNVIVMRNRKILINRMIENLGNEEMTEYKYIFGDDGIQVSNNIGTNLQIKYNTINRCINKKELLIINSKVGYSIVIHKNNHDEDKIHSIINLIKEKRQDKYEV